MARVATGKFFETDNIFTNNNKDKYKNVSHPPIGYDSIRGFVNNNNDKST